MEFLSEIISRQRFGIENGSHIRDGILFVLEGSFSCEICGKREIAEVGNICVFPANTPFRRYVLQPIRCVYLQFAAFPVRLPPGLLQTSDPVRRENTIAHLAEAVEAGHRDLTEHFFRDILVLHGCGEQAAVCRDPLVAECICFLEDHFAETVTLEDLSVRFSLTKQGLIRKFKQSAGKTPMEYLTHIRMNRSRQLLRDTALSVGEIALCCGYENVYYFSNVFKAQTGIRPSDYRKLHAL